MTLNFGRGDEIT